MKQLLLIAITLQLSLFNAFASDSLKVERPLVNNVIRNFYIKEQLDLYKSIPSNISLWENGDFSSIGLNLSKDREIINL